ncbi:MAG: hypothetical protein SFU27_13095 [Thermonemataceae bacterium]|nr:hypothetical protein [Thermonemataceae bacterium]
MQELSEIAAFLDFPLFFVEEKSIQKLQNADILFVFASQEEQNYFNKNKERVFEKLLQALLVKYPFLKNKTIREIVLTNSENILEQIPELRIAKVIFFGQDLAKKLSLNQQINQVHKVGEVFSYLVATSIATMEENMEEKKKFWLALLEFLAEG